MLSRGHVRYSWFQLVIVFFLDNKSEMNEINDTEQLMV